MWFLIITMSSNMAFSYQGYGGVSVTPMESRSQCRAVAEITRRQISETEMLTFDGNEIIVRCEFVEK